MTAIPSHGSAPKANDDEPWEHTIPVDKKSPHGLPLGLLNKAAFARSPANLEQILNNAPHHPGDEAERKMWQASALVLQKRYEQADDEFEKLKNWQDFPCSVKTLMGRSFTQNQKFDKAIEVFSQVIAKEPSPIAYTHRAGCYASTNKLLEAAHDYESAAKLARFSERSNLVKGANLMLKAGHIQEALGYIDRAEKCARPTPSPSLYMVKADCYIKLGQREKAVECLDKAEAAANKLGAESTGEVFLPTIVGARAKLYKSLGKFELERRDQKKLETMSNSIMDEVVGKRDQHKYDYK